MMEEADSSTGSLCYDAGFETNPSNGFQSVDFEGLRQLRDPKAICSDSEGENSLRHPLQIGTYPEALKRERPQDNCPSLAEVEEASYPFKKRRFR